MAEAHIRFALYLSSLSIYVILAAWVGQDAFSEDAFTRALAVMFGLLWVLISGAVIEENKLPQKLASLSK